MLAQEGEKDRGPFFSEKIEKKLLETVEGKQFPFVNCLFTGSRMDYMIFVGLLEE